MNVFNLLDGVGVGKMNMIGKKGLLEEIGVFGMYKKVENLFVE